MYEFIVNLQTKYKENASFFQKPYNHGIFKHFLFTLIFLGMNSSSQRNVLECTVDGKNVIWYACLNQTPYLPLPAVVAHINNSTECGKQDISIRE